MHQYSFLMSKVNSEPIKEALENANFFHGYTSRFCAYVATRVSDSITPDDLVNELEHSLRDIVLESTGIEGSLWPYKSELVRVAPIHYRQIWNNFPEIFDKLDLSLPRQYSDFIANARYQFNRRLEEGASAFNPQLIANYDQAKKPATKNKPPELELFPAEPRRAVA